MQGVEAGSKALLPEKPVKVYTVASAMFAIQDTTTGGYLSHCSHVN
jgi:hypothetical protein